MLRWSLPATEWLPGNKKTTDEKGKLILEIAWAIRSASLEASRLTSAGMEKLCSAQREQLLMYHQSISVRFCLLFTYFLL